MFPSGDQDKTSLKRIFLWNIMYLLVFINTSTEWFFSGWLIKWNALENNDYFVSSHFFQDERTVFICRNEECKKEFPNKPLLRQHEEIHNESADHVCEQCGKGFKSQRYLSTHMKSMHSGTKYVCTDCGKVYAQSSGYRMHRKMHHSDQPIERLKCSMCKHTFMSPSKCPHVIFIIRRILCFAELCMRVQIEGKSMPYRQNSTCTERCSIWTRPLSGRCANIPYSVSL